LDQLVERVQEPRRFITALIGPRQVGKTTLVEQLIARDLVPAHSVSADDALEAANDLWIDQQWERARIIQRTEGTALLVIDEIQKIANWSAVVKRNWDADTKNKADVKVILLGSAQMLIQKGLTESLAGRFEVIPVNHWQYSEMETAFGFTAREYAWFGGYPGAAALIKDERRWKDYVNNALIETTLMKDILLLSRIDKPALLRQLFDLACHYSGQIISFNKMLGQLQEAGNSSTLNHYLHLLDSAGFVSGVPKYYEHLLQQKGSIPKLQVQNTAFISARSVKAFDAVSADPVAWGRVIESAIGAHLLNRQVAGMYKTYYWRDRNDEVDFVLQRGEEIIAIEVKSGISNKAAGLKVFQKKFEPSKTLMVGISGIPWAEFLKLEPGSLF